MVAAGGCTGEVRVTYPSVPSTLVLRTVTTTVSAVKPYRVQLPALDLSSTTTSTIGFLPSSGSLRGVVNGPEGPVAGAKVRIERLVGSQVAFRVVDADRQGHYELVGVELGRVRVRAWRPPDLAMMSDDVFFTENATTHDLELTTFGRTDVQWAIAPASPITGSKANIVVQVSTRAVDAEGLISVVPLSGVGVTVMPLGVLVPTEVGERLTNAEGRATFTLRCDGSGAADLDVRLATGGQALLAPPPCSTPLITAPSTLVPPPSVDPSVSTTTPPVPTVAVLAPTPGGPVVSLVPVPVVPQQ